MVRVSVCVYSVEVRVCIACVCGCVCVCVHFAASPCSPCLSQYIVMTFDDWPRTLYRMQDAWSNEAFIWFLLFCFITVFFILNLTLASVEESFRCVPAE